MLVRTKSFVYDANTGYMTAVLDTSLMNGYPNTVDVYSTPQIMAFPENDVNLAILDNQSQAQTQLLAIYNKIKDTHYIIEKGEITLFSTNWYNSVRKSGVELQPVNNANKENAMMGQSTNKVLADILDYCNKIYNSLLQMDSVFASHTHSGVQSGNDNSGTPSAPFPPPPLPTKIISDTTYIEANHNLAITGVYSPYA
jgi:hypothetical protein